MVHTPKTPIRELSLEEGREMVDKLARQYLNMGMDEFIAMWDAGNFADPDKPEVMRIAMLLPFVRNGR